MTDIKIYNSNQIGGCITIISSENTKIMIDFGSNLPGAESKEKEIDWEAERIDAVLFTHYHGDHIGRFKEIPESIPLYMGKLTKKVLTTISQCIEDEEAIKILNNNERVQGVSMNKPFKIGDICITPYKVDHSAFDSYMYLLETPEKTILHTGDFRGHGYKGKKLIDMIWKYVRKYGKRDVDILMTEGTMLSRLTEKIYSEADMKRDCEELFKENKYIFLICSSTNVDSLATFYNAGENNSMKMFVNGYIYEQIKNYREDVGNSDLYSFKYVYKYEPDRKIYLKRTKKVVTQEEIMRTEGFITVIKAEEGYKKWLERFKDLKPLVIYSMWEGYINPEHKAYKPEWKEFLDSCENVKYMHTSGHATPELIAEVINEVDPKERIYPMHTENAKGFEKLNIKEELKGRIYYGEEEI